MDLSPFVDSLRSDLEAAAAAGGEQARSTAALLAVALDASVRLCLVDALSAMAAEVTTAVEPTSVEIRMHGREPQVVVTAGAPEPEAEVDAPAPAAEGEPDRGPDPEPEDDEGGTARVSLRLPESLKVQAEARAAAEGQSLNSWLVRAVAAAVQPTPAAGTRTVTGGRRLTGYARS